MKNAWKVWLKRMCMLCLTLVAAQSAYAVPTVSLSTASNLVSTGAEIDVQVQIHDVVDLYGYQFTLLFDPSIMQASAGQAGSLLDSAGSNFFDGGVADNANGSVSLVFGSLLGPVFGVNGSGTLASFHFLVTGTGVGTFRLADTLFLDSTLSDITVQSASMAVTAVPEPSPGWLMLIGMPLLALAGRRSRI